jgi:hypothetical protein
MPQSLGVPVGETQRQRLVAEGGGVVHRLGLENGEGRPAGTCELTGHGEILSVKARRWSVAASNGASIDERLARAMRDNESHARHRVRGLLDANR